MYKDFLYFKFDNYIPSHICDEIIKNHTQFIDGTIEGKRLDQRTPMVEQSYRKSQIQWITTPFYTNLIFQIFQQCNSEWEFDITSVEPLQLTKYVAPDGHYDFHQDGNGYTRENINDSVRKLSMSCLLNDANDFDGVVLHTNTSGGIDDIEMNKGDIVVFPSYLMHRVTPVTRGERYSLVAWACGKPLK